MKVDGPTEDAERTRIRIKNRRKRYLDLHPEYFEEPSLELAGRQSSHPLVCNFTFSSCQILPPSSPPCLSAQYPIPTHPPDPLLYDRLVRRHQSAAEREAQGRSRGYADILEADLIRSEAKLEAARHPDPNSPVVYTRQANGEIVGMEQDQLPTARRVGHAGDGEDESEKQADWDRWVDVISQRFLRGEDANFDYSIVDENEDFDDRDEEARAGLERYLEDEEASLVGEGSPEGETGVQDF